MAKNGLTKALCEDRSDVGLHGEVFGKDEEDLGRSLGHLMTRRSTSLRPRQGAKGCFRRSDQECRRRYESTSIGCGTGNRSEATEGSKGSRDRRAIPLLGESSEVGRQHAIERIQHWGWCIVQG